MEKSSKSPASIEDVQLLRQAFSSMFVEESFTLDRPEVGHISFRGWFQEDPASSFDKLKEHFNRLGFTPFIREDNGAVLIAAPVVFKPRSSNWLINFVLLIATILSTMYIGAAIEFSIQELDGTPGIDDLLLGLPYCLSIMAILGAHELGHYFAARYHKVPVSLPYFIPLPLPPFGTLGAFIRLKAPLTNKRTLLDVGAAGPLAGFFLAIPILLYGLSISPIQTLPESYSLEGNSVLYALAKIVVKGQMYPTGNEDIFLGQIAWAGWVGLFVTGLNLIPVGQLDGGHIAYALFGKRARFFYWPVLAALVLLIILTETYAWILWVVLLFIFGRVHAEPLDNLTALDKRRRLVAIFSLLLFVLVFVPTPLQLVAP